MASTASSAPSVGDRFETMSRAMPRSSAAASARAASVATAVLLRSSRSRPVAVDDGESAGTSTRIAIVGGIAARISSCSALLSCDRMRGSHRGATQWSISSPTASNPTHRDASSFDDTPRASAYSDASARDDDDASLTSSFSSIRGDVSGPRTTPRTMASAPAASSGLDASLSTAAAARWNLATGPSHPVVMGALLRVRGRN